MEKNKIPPLNFSMVESGLYRSGFPNKRNFEFLKTLNLKSIVYLCHHSYREENLKFTRESNITVFNCPIDGNKEPFLCIDPNSMSMAIQFIIDKNNHPLLVHCTKGTHRTGCVIGCLRKKQSWSLTSIFDEYCRFAGPRIRLLDQQFIEFFRPKVDEETKIENMPNWITK